MVYLVACKLAWIRVISRKKLRHFRMNYITRHSILGTMIVAVLTVVI